MGQVSILEDIEKALENLEALKGETLRPPTALSIAAQEKRLEKERLRLHDISLSLIGLAKSLKNKIDSPAFKEARELLQIQDIGHKIERLKSEKADFEKRSLSIRTLMKSLKELERQEQVYVAKIDILQKGYSFEGKSTEIRIQEIKRFIALTLPEITEQHPRIQELKKQIAAVKKERQPKNAPPKNVWRSD